MSGDLADPAGIAGVFNRAADTYDNVGVEWFRPIGAWLVDALAPQPGERVLDVGCGRGAVLLPLAEAVGPSGYALGIDLAPRMVQATAREAAHLPQVEVRVGDASALDVAGAFDVVASSLVLFFLPDPAAALSSWVEVLAPDGRLGVSTFGTQAPHLQELDEVFTPYLPPELRAARSGGRSGPFGSDEGMEALCTGAGLREVRTLRHTLTATFEDTEQWHAFSWSHGQRAAWECVPADQRDRVRSAAEAVLERSRDADGRLRWTQEVRLTLGRL